MRLDQCEIRPGRVLKVIDNYGTIKASVQGMFADSDDPDLLPPIIPFIINSPSAFSMPHEGDYIWVWRFMDNPQELLYNFRCNTQKQNGEELDNEYTDAEILMKRKTNKGNAQIIYNTDDGCTIDNDGSKINIDNKNNDIHINHSKGMQVSISEKGISLGNDGGSDYKAVCGEELVRCLKDIKNVLVSIKDASMNNPHTSHIGLALSPLLPKLSNFEKILSNTVTLNK